MTTPGFRDRLLAELTELIPAESQPSNPSSIIRTTRRRQTLIGLSAAAAVATALVVVPIVRGPSGTPAWAVEQTSDGNVTVTVRRISDVEGLERQIRANGIPAVVRAGTPDCAIWTNPYQPS